MDILSPLLSGIGLGRLEKPFIFVSMLMGLIAFGAAGIVIIFASLGFLWTEGLSKIGPALGLVFMGFLLVALASVCAYMMKRCFD